MGRGGDVALALALVGIGMVEMKVRDGMGVDGSVLILRMRCFAAEGEGDERRECSFYRGVMKGGGAEEGWLCEDSLRGCWRCCVTRNRVY